MEQGERRDHWPQVPGYRLIRELGRGGFATVYEAIQLSVERPVALKVMSLATVEPEVERRFRAESRTVASLSWHPHVVALYDAGIAPGGVPFLAMELVSGGSWGDRLRDGAALPPEEVVQAGLHVSDALDAAHGAGVIHRDIKPDNILVGRRGEALLTDFGIATLADATRSATGSFTGTFAYSAPEVLQGRRASQASDVYAVGTTLYTLVTGRAAFLMETDESPAAVLFRIVSQDAPPLPPAVPATLRAVIEQCMAKEPSERFASAGALAAALSTAAAQGPVVSHGWPTQPPTVPVPPGNPPHRDLASPAPVNEAVSPTMAGHSPPPPPDGSSPAQVDSSGRRPVRPGRQPEQQGRQRTMLLALGVAGLLIVLVIAAVVATSGRGDESANRTATTAASDPAGAAAPAAGGGDGDGLVIGGVLPQTGPLAFLGPPQIEGAKLAIEDVNAGGGVLGENVVLNIADEGETPVIAAESATRVVSEGANAVIGAASSGSSQEFIQQLSDQMIPQCSASNTSPDFTDQPNADFYFRTVPPDESVAPIIADRVIADGAAKVVVVARADDYGSALGELVIDQLTAAGAEVPPLVRYDPEATNFSTEINLIAGEFTDAVVIISFDEGGQILAGLLEEGLTPDQFYGSDGVFGPTFIDQVQDGDPNVIDGMTVIGAAGGEEFNDRIDRSTAGNFIYGGQAYDCVIILALAAESAGSNDGAAIMAEVPGVTAEGRACDSFEACKALLEDGQDIDYSGASGGLDLNQSGDPTIGRYAIGQFNNGGIDILASADVAVG